MVYRFFNKDGDLITPEYGKYSLPHINILFKQCSVGLFSTETIYFLEECYNAVDTIVKTDKISLNDINRSELYRLLTYLNSSINPVPLNELNWNILGEDFPNDINRNREHWLSYSEYINESFNNIFYYTINDKGKQYLENFDELSAQKYFEDELGFTKILVKPRLPQSSTLYFKWRKRDENINFFKVSETDIELFDKYRNITEYKEKLPLIEKLDIEDINESNMFEFDSENIETDTFTTDNSLYNTNLSYANNPQRILNTNVYSKQPIRFNFCFNADEADVYTSDLDIYIRNENNNVIEFEPLLTISFQAEAVGESERFVKMLENFGRNLDVSHFDAIQGADLEDANPDYIFINEKRKELLIEGPEIFDHAGSFKCLENGLKWLNAKDVKIREYFYNIKTWKESEYIDYKSYDSEFDFEYDFTIDTYKKNSVEEKFDTQVVNSADWKKTTRLGLVYYYNQALQKVDSKTDLPIVETNEGFSPEELLIYFYNMKKTLEKVFLPHNARIINITLEGVYFAKFNLLEFKNEIGIKHIDYLNMFYDFTLESSLPKKLSFNKIAKYLFNNDIPKVSKIGEIYPYTVDSLNNIEFDILANDINSEDFKNADIVLDFIKNNFTTADEFLEYCEEFWPDYNNSNSFGYYLLNVAENDLTWSDYSSKKWKELQAVDVNVNRYATPTTNNDEKYLLVNDKYIKDSHGSYSNNIINNYNLDRGLNDTNIDYDENNNPYPEISYTWENTNISKNSKIEWKITNEATNESIAISGTFNQYKQLLVPLYKYGTYSVRCRITNVNNYPHIVFKKSYLILEPPSFIVYGMCENTYNYYKNDYKHSTDNFLENTKYFSEDYLNYYNYLNQNFVSNQIEYTHLCTNLDKNNQEIINIDYQTMLFAKTYEFNYDNLYLYPSDEFDYNMEFLLDKNTLSSSNIAIEYDNEDDLPKLPIGKTYHTLYNKRIIDRTRFEIRKDYIIISIENMDGLELILKEGCSITLVSSENEKVNFYVSKTEINYINNTLIVYTNRMDEITLYDDINYRRSTIEEDFGYYNIRTWEQLEINYNKKLFESNGFNIDSENQLLNISLETGLPNDYEKLIKNNEDDIYIKINTLPNEEIVIPISDVELKNSKIKINSNCYFNNITSCHILCFAKFDIGNAISHSSFNKLFPNYHSQIKNKVYLYGWENITPTNGSYFKFNNEKKIVLNFDTNEINSNDYSTLEEYKEDVNKLKLEKTLNILNNNSKSIKFYYKKS